MDMPIQGRCWADDLERLRLSGLGGVLASWRDIGTGLAMIEDETVVGLGFLVSA